MSRREEFACRDPRLPLALEDDQDVLRCLKRLDKQILRRDLLLSRYLTTSGKKETFRTTDC